VFDAVGIMNDMTHNVSPYKKLRRFFNRVTTAIEYIWMDFTQMPKKARFTHARGAPQNDCLAFRVTTTF
jgi:hypothetical protein